ncbi:MAG: hypothetical protein ACK4NV_16805 [Pannonibacter sp.]
MNRIVRSGYPVEKLPEDLRGGLPAGVKVQVTVETDSPAAAVGQASPLDEVFKRTPDRLRMSSGDLATLLDHDRDAWGG